MHGFRVNLTKSRYNGEYCEKLHRMHGLGHYVFPDGTEYRGFFEKGKFHGYGRVKLVSPYNFVIKGTFQEGKLIEIDEMTFRDRLHVDVKNNVTNLDFDNWTYCHADDRRFCTELEYGLEAVGPNSLLTKDRIPRDIRTNCYDIEEGIYSHESHFVGRRKPYIGLRFVGCKAEEDWILKHCRKGDDEMHPEVPDPKICRAIINVNVCSATHKANSDCICNVHNCNAVSVKEQRKINFAPSIAHSIYEPAETLDLPASTNSSVSLSCCSMQENPMIIDVNERLDFAIKNAELHEESFDIPLLQRFTTSVTTSVQEELLKDKKRSTTFEK